MFAPTQRDLPFVPLRESIDSSMRRTWSPRAVHGLPKQTHLSRRATRRLRVGVSALTRTVHSTSTPRQSSGPSGLCALLWWDLGSAHGPPDRLLTRG